MTAAARLPRRPGRHHLRAGRGRPAGDVAPTVQGVDLVPVLADPAASVRDHILFAQDSAQTTGLNQVRYAVAGLLRRPHQVRPLLRGGRGQALDRVVGQARRARSCSTSTAPSTTTTTSGTTTMPTRSSWSTWPTTAPAARSSARSTSGSSPTRRSPSCRWPDAAGPTEAARQVGRPARGTPPPPGPGTARTRRPPRSRDRARRRRPRPGDRTRSRTSRSLVAVVPGLGPGQAGQGLAVAPVEAHHEVGPGNQADLEGAGPVTVVGIAPALEGSPRPPSMGSPACQPPVPPLDDARRSPRADRRRGPVRRPDGAARRLPWASGRCCRCRRSRPQPAAATRSPGRRAATRSSLGQPVDRARSHPVPVAE